MNDKYELKEPDFKKMGEIFSEVSSSDLMLLNQMMNVELKKRKLKQQG